MTSPAGLTLETRPIYDFIVQLLEEKGTLPEPDAMLAYPYLRNGHIDSLAFIKFIFRIEERFAIRFSEADMLSEPIRTVGGLIGLVAGKCNQACDA